MFPIIFRYYRSMQFSLCNDETSMARNINKNKLGCKLRFLICILNYLIVDFFECEFG